MQKKVRIAFYSIVALGALFVTSHSFAAKTATKSAIDKSMSLWDLIVAGGICMIPLTLISVAATALIIYHFRSVTAQKLVPQDFIESLLSLLEKGEVEKARSLSKQQPNMISAITLKGLSKINRGSSVMQEAIQHEGRERVEGLWRNLGYLGDMAVIAPMLGLLGTVFGMIQAFNYQAFKAGIIKPIILAEGLAQAMITTAYGLIIAIPILAFYAYFRGRISSIMATAERVSSEVAHLLGNQAEVETRERTYSRK